MKNVVLAILIATTPWFDPDTVPPASDVLELADDETISWGGSADCQVEWDTGAATHNWRAVCTDVDGAGTDGVIWSVDTGTDDVVYTGTLTCEVPAGTSDYDAFVVSDSGLLKFRTSAEMITDLALDGRYYTEAELDAGQLDNRYYTETELDAGQLDSRYYTEAELDADQLTIYALVDGSRSPDFTGPVSLDGSTDAVQLAVEANATQANTNPLIELRASGGAAIGALHTDDASNVFIGSGAGDANAVSGADGVNNIYVGQNAGGAISSGAGNIALGVGALDTTTGADNTIAIGKDSLQALTNGAGNLGIGTESLYTISTADFNTAIGYQALYTSNSGYNVAIGYQAAKLTSSGQSNVAIGYLSLTSNLTGGSNIGIGTQSLTACDDGNHNMAFGAGSQIALEGGDYNTSIGTNTLKAVVDAQGSTAIGYRALEENTSNYITAIGYDSARYNSSGTRNVAVGYKSVENNQTGNYNTGVGYNACNGTSSNSFSGNTCVGDNTGAALTTGGNNVLLGAYMGDNLTTGAGNILIGYNINGSAATRSNEINIGNTIHGEIDTGDVGIGDSTPEFRLEVYDSGATYAARFWNDGDSIDYQGIIIRCGDDSGTLVGQDTYYILAEDGNGTDIGVIEEDGGTFQLTSLSDERLKKDIAPTKLSGLEIIDGIEPIEFRWDKEGETGLNRIGLSAQNIEPVYPEMVSESPDGNKMIAPTRLIPVLVKAVKEQQELIDKLTSRVETLEAIR